MKKLSILMLSLLMIQGLAFAEEAAKPVDPQAEVSATTLGSIAEEELTAEEKAAADEAALEEEAEEEAAAAKEAK